MKYLLFLLTLMLSSTFVEAQSITRVITRYHTANDFKTITSYLTNGEDRGPRIVERSKPGDWAGMYFIVEFEERPETFSKKVSLVLDVITPFTPKPLQYNYTLNDTDHFTWEAYVGITGHDWPDSEVEPIAWKLTLKDFEGNILSEKQSFLWE